MQSSVSFNSSDPPSQIGDAGTRNNKRRAWLIIVGFWVFFGLLNGTQLYLGLKMEDFPVVFWRVFANDLFAWSFWIPATFVVLSLGRRLLVERGKLLRVLPLHLVACVLISVLHSAFATFVNQTTQPFGPPRVPRTFLEMFVGRAVSQFHLDLLIYATVLGLSYAVSYYVQYREREFRASQLENQLAQAQLQTLKMQLQPHFLFNTLNGIAGLVRDSKNKAAVEMLAGLSDLLRYTLESAGKQEVPLKEELEFLELYLDIQQMRFSDRMHVEMQIDPEAFDALVPNLILQPLVENAIRHGISQRAASGLVGVTANRVDDTLRIRIYDDGVGLGRADGRVEGVGLSNTRARLAQLYGDRQRFSITERDGGGTEAELIIPFARNGTGAAGAVA